NKQKELANSKAQIAAVQPQIDTIKTAQAAISGRLDVARTLTSSRMNWDRALNDFARIIPTNSFLTSIQMTAPVTAAAQTAAATAAATPTSTDGTSEPAAPVAAPTVSTLTLAGTAPSTPGVA